MTEKQTALYFRRWGAVRRILRARGFSASEADAERKAIHARAGAPASSKRFTNQHLDSVLEEFDAIQHPGRLPDRRQASAKRRLVYSIRHILRHSGLDHPDEYCAAIAQDKFRQTDLHRLDLDQLQQLLITLRSRLLSPTGDKPLSGLVSDQDIGVF